MNRAKSQAKVAKAKSAPATAQALAFAKLLDTPDPALQVAHIEHLLKLSAAPVMTLVIQADTRAAADTVTLVNIGPAIPGPIVNMMLAAAQKQLAERQAQAEAQKTAAKAAPDKKG